MIETSEEVDTVVDYINAVYPSNFEESKRHCLNVLHRWRPVPSKELSFVGDLLAHDGHATQAQLAFDRVLRRDPFYAEAYLGIANLALTMKKRHEWKRWLARYFEYHGTPGIEFDANTAIAPFSIVCPTVPPISDSPKVTIVMTTYNSSALLNHSVLSVLRQSIRNLEIFIVDDCSTDETPKLIQELAKTDRRIKPIYNDKNIGTYASKNKAIVLSSGTFVTFHDSDDWMHPRRIERYLTAMTDDTFCCTSQWIRMDQVGRVVVRRTNPYTHLNPASTFFRRTAFDQIGLFDEVRVGADAEFITRAYHFSGKRAFTDLGACLGIGLHHENSLTRSGEASFDQFRYSPIRLEYTENWVERQLEQFGRSPVPKIPS
jgi:hypothetical protein